MESTIKQCATCENVTLGYHCHICEQQAQEGGRYGRMPAVDTLCTDCAPPCISCGEPVCESHRRSSGECSGCTGPTDAEQQADGGSYYSSERMASVMREGK